MQCFNMQVVLTYSVYDVLFVVLCLVFRPDGEELAVSTLDGQITFWNIRGVVQTGSVEGRRDLQVGRSVEHKVTAKHLAGGRCVLYI